MHAYYIDLYSFHVSSCLLLFLFWTLLLAETCSGDEVSEDEDAQSISDEKSTSRLTMLDLRLIFPDSFCSGCVIDTRRSGGTVTRPARCQDTYLFRLGIRMDHLFCWDFVAEREGEQKRNLKCFFGRVN